MGDLGWLLPAAWASLGALIFLSSLRAASNRRAYLIGVTSVSVLWLVAGAGANAYFLARGDNYSGFADAASTAFVRETWESLVVPRHKLFIGLLILFEAAAGALVLAGGKVRQAALLLLIAFNVALVSFGWGYLVWSVPMGLALWLLWRAGRRVPATVQRPGHGPRRPAAAGRRWGHRAPGAFAETRLEDVARAAQNAH